MRAEVGREKHVRWLRAKLAKSAADPRIPHEQVMAEVQAIIDRATAGRLGQ